MLVRKLPDMVRYLKQRGVYVLFNTNGTLLNEYGWGGYLIWSLGPQQKVFIDGRADIYEYAGVLPDYISMTRMESSTMSPRASPSSAARGSISSSRARASVAVP